MVRNAALSLLRDVLAAGAGTALVTSVVAVRISQLAALVSVRLLRWRLRLAPPDETDEDSDPRALAPVVSLPAQWVGWHR